MKIELIDSEINDALQQYVENQGINIGDADVEIVLIPGRKKGNTATINILPKGTLKVAETVKESTPEPVKEESVEKEPEDSTSLFE